MRLIIVDDSQIIREKLKELLQDIYNVEVVADAADGFEALEKWELHRPDVVILDLKIPKLDGIKVLEKIKSSNIPVVVIVLTNFGSTYFRDVCLNSGADYFLDKTNDFEQVFEICEKLAEKSS